jgi:hypothetical protein
MYVNGDVHYVHGTEPAYDIEVWLKVSHGWRSAGLGFITPQDRQRGFTAMPMQGELEARPPFAALDGPLPEAGEVMIGWRWKTSDGQVDMQTDRQSFDSTPEINPDLYRTGPPRS